MIVALEPRQDGRPRPHDGPPVPHELLPLAPAGGFVHGARLRDALAGIALLRLHARHELLEDLAVEPFMGNLWRGQLGAWWHAHAPAAFAALMDESGGGRHWALRPPWADAGVVPAGAVMDTRVTLIGPALAHERAVVDALEAVGMKGFGPRQGPGGGRARARLIALNVEALPAGGDALPNLLDVIEHAPEPTVPGSPRDDGPLCIDLETPLRFKVDGQVFTGVPTMEQLLRRTFGRLVQLLPDARVREAHAKDERHPRLFDPDEHAAWLRAAAHSVCIEHDLQAWTWHRRSRRTGQVMMLEGVSGRLRFHGSRNMLLPWLRVADWLQIGSRTTFGFGALAAA